MLTCLDGLDCHWEFFFFRASSGKGASQALQSLSHKAGFEHLNFSELIQKRLQLLVIFYNILTIFFFYVVYF